LGGGPRYTTEGTRATLALLLCILGAFVLVAIRLGIPPNEQSLIRALSDRDPAIRARAAFELSQEHQSSPAAIIALANVLEDSDEDPRSEAVAALISIGRHDTAEGGAVTRAMSAIISRQSVGRSLRMQAIQVLGQLGRSGRSVEEPLLLVLAGEDDEERAAAAAALGQAGAGGAETIRALERAVADPMPEVRAAALESLARMRPGDTTPRVAARWIMDTLRTNGRHRAHATAARYAHWLFGHRHADRGGSFTNNSPARVVS
jgi:HEAT repeat protein